MTPQGARAMPKCLHMGIISRSKSRLEEHVGCVTRGRQESRRAGGLCGTHNMTFHLPWYTTNWFFPWAFAYVFAAATHHAGESLIPR
jgi:hypothetical protein